MESYNPLVSVIIPCFNSEKYIERAIDSILEQSYKNIEIICVNDGSTDETQSILNRYSQEYKNIKIINKQNKGVILARYDAIKISNGDLLSFIDSDDFIERDAILAGVNKIGMSNTDAAVFEVYFSDGRKHKPYITYNDDRIKGIDAFVNTLHGWCIGSYGIYKKNITLTSYDDFFTLNLDSFNSDEYLVRLFFLNCNEISKVNKKYYYFHNEDSAFRKFKLNWVCLLDTIECLKNKAIEINCYEESKLFLFEELIQRSWWLRSELKKNMKTVSNSDALLYKNKIMKHIRSYSLMEYINLLSKSSKNYKFKIKAFLLIIGAT